MKTLFLLISMFILWHVIACATRPAVNKIAIQSLFSCDTDADCCWKYPDIDPDFCFGKR